MAHKHRVQRANIAQGTILPMGEKRRRKRQPNGMYWHIQQFIATAREQPWL